MEVLCRISRINQPIHTKISRKYCHRRIQMKNSETQQKIPPWLSEEFFTDILQNDAHINKRKLKIVFISSPIPQGEHFCSVLTRVTLAIASTKEHVSLIVKEPPRGELLRHYLKEAGAFTKEITVYKAFLPILQRISELSNLEEVKKSLTAKCYYSCSVTNTVILEDLSPLGFKMADRRRGLDYDHCVTALKALARFHGLSVVMHEEMPNSMDLFRTMDYVEEKLEVWRPSVENSFIRLAKSMEECSGYEHFGGKLRRVAKTSTGKMLGVMKHGSWNVLNHGDFWLNNVLFSYSDAGKVDEVRLLDFQVSRFASPALDLHYFFTTSPSMEVRQSGLDTLLKVYHVALCEVLISLGCGHKRITYGQLEREMKEKEFYSIFTAVSVLGIILANPGDSPNFDDLTEDSKNVGGDDIMDITYSGKHYISMMKYLLPIFEEKGLL